MYLPSLFADDDLVLGVVRVNSIEGTVTLVEISIDALEKIKFQDVQSALEISLKTCIQISQ